MSWLAVSWAGVAHYTSSSASAVRDGRGFSRARACPPWEGGAGKEAHSGLRGWESAEGWSQRAAPGTLEPRLAAAAQVWVTLSPPGQSPAPSSNTPKGPSWQGSVPWEGSTSAGAPLL